MKNFIISILAAYIFYTQLCVVKIPATIPVIVLFGFAFCCEVEDIMRDISNSNGRRAHEDD